MTRQLHVAVYKDGQPFLDGNFDVPEADYPLVAALLKEVDMTHAQAAALLSGYMHARAVGRVTEDMGKLAMIAAVYMLEAGETDITVPLSSEGTGTQH